MQQHMLPNNASQRHIFPMSGFLKPLLFRCLVFLWRILEILWGIIGALVLGVLGNAVYTDLTQGEFVPINLLFFTQWVSAHAFLAIFLLCVLGVLTVAAYRAHRSSLQKASQAKQSDYTLRPVKQLNPANFKLSRYISRAYIFRDTDQFVRQTLRSLATNLTMGPETPLGICLFGKPGQGKTRLIWEAMRAELSEWVLVRWPHERNYPFDFATHEGQHLVLWLDDLHEYTNPTEAASLADLPRRFAERNIRLIILATCRDGNEQILAQRWLNSFLEQLLPFTLENIAADQAINLTKVLVEEGLEVHGEDFDGTPGSLVLGLRRMQDRYRHLPAPAQSLLKTMKLLRSTQIYTYPLSTVRAVAYELFQFDEGQWRNAWEMLVHGGFVQVTTSASGERFCEQVADMYLERVVVDYPLPHGRLTDDWLDLKHCLEQHRDGEGLNSLGRAFRYEERGSWRSNRECAVNCHLAALQVYTREQAPAEWAMTQNNLGMALRAQAEIAEPEEQRSLLAQAVQAYQVVLQVYTNEQSPTQRAMTQNNLGNALYAQAQIAKPEEREALLAQAVQAYQAVLQVNTQEQHPVRWASTQNNLGIVLRTQAQIAKPEQRGPLLTQAVQAYQAALQIRTREYAPVDWAMTQNNLGNVLLIQAETEQRGSLLAQAIQAYQTALQVYTSEQIPADWAMTQNNLETALYLQTALAEVEKEKA